MSRAEDKGKGKGKGMYTVYGRCGQYGRCMVHTLAGAAGAWFIRTQLTGSLHKY